MSETLQLKELGPQSPGSSYLLLCSVQGASEKWASPWIAAGDVTFLTEHRAGIVGAWVSQVPGWGNQEDAYLPAERGLHLPATYMTLNLESFNVFS